MLPKLQALFFVVEGEVVDFISLSPRKCYSPLFAKSYYLLAKATPQQTNNNCEETFQAYYPVTCNQMDDLKRNINSGNDNLGIPYTALIVDNLH